MKLTLDGLTFDLQSCSNVLIPPFLGDTEKRAILETSWKLGPSIDAGHWSAIHEISAETPLNWPGTEFVAKTEWIYHPVKGVVHPIFLRREYDAMVKIMSSHGTSSVSRAMDCPIAIPIAFTHVKLTELQDHGLIAIMITPRYQMSLMNWIESQKAGQIPLSVSLGIFDSGLQSLEYIHRANYVHDSIKPENMMLRSVGSKEATSEDQDHGPLDFVIIDLGRAQRSSATLPRLCKANHRSTPFPSMRRSQGFHPAFRDDLESLLHVFIFLLTGTLPWYDLASERKFHETGFSKRVSNAKRDADLTAQVTQEQLRPIISDMLAHIRSLEPEQVPDYRLMSNLLNRAKSQPLINETNKGDT